MAKEVVTRVTEEDARKNAGRAFRDSTAEGAADDAISVTDSIEIELTPATTVEVSIGAGPIAADSDDLDVLPPGFATLQKSLRATNSHETIATSVRFKKAGDSVKVIVVGYIQNDAGVLVRMSLQEQTATATARFDDDGFWAQDLLWPTGAMPLYQVRVEAPADLVKVFSWTF